MLDVSLTSSAEYLLSKYQFVIELLKVFKIQIFQFWFHFLSKIIHKNYYKRMKSNKSMYRQH